MLIHCCTILFLNPSAGAIFSQLMTIVEEMITGNIIPILPFLFLILLHNVNEMKSCWEEISFCSIFVCWLVTIKADCVDFICWLTKQFLIEIWKICSHKKGTLFFFSDVKFWLERLELPQVTTIQNIGSKANKFLV